MDMENSILEVKDLRINIEQRTILEKVSFSIRKGEVLAIVGPNGAGKSTLFRALLGLVPYAGTITWASDIRLGYVPQKLSIDHGIPMTVQEFMELRTRDEQKIHDVLNAVGLKHDVCHTMLGSVSGGELQRVLIAWALAGNPNVLLFDEPTAGIDVSGEKTIYELLHQIKQARDLTVLLITHDDHVVNQSATNVLELHKKMISFGPASAYHHDHPAHH